MEWLSQLTGGQILQGGTVLAIVLSAIYYITHWQQIFTDRLEKQGERDEVRIKELGDLVDAERRRRRAADDRAAQAIYLLHQNGIPVPSEIEEPPDHG